MSYEYISFLMKLKPNNENEYKKRHKNIWPELITALKNAGINEYRIFYDKNTDMLFAFQQINQCNSVEELSSLPIMKKWWEMMSDIMEHNEDKSPRVCFLEQVFDFKNHI